MLNTKPKLLVVDDERAIVSARATILESQGYETAAAYSGEEAVQMAYSFHPDCIVSDITMGAMNGVEAAIEILAVLPRCKVLFISGDPGYDDDLGNAMAKDFRFEILAKPVPPSDLLAKISQILSSQPTDRKTDRTGHMAKRRGNPNWGKSETIVPPLTLTEFEQVTREFKLQPDQYISSIQLREWARHNKNSKFIPEPLLEAWGFEVQSTF